MLTFRLSDRESLLTEEEQRETLDKAGSCVMPQEELSNALLIYERKPKPRHVGKQATDGKEGMVRALILSDAAGLEILLMQSEASFWRAIELCPKDGNIIEKVEDVQRCKTCLSVVSEIETGFPSHSLVAPSYEDNTYSGVVKESREGWKALEDIIALRWEESTSHNVLSSTLAASELVESLRAFVEEFSTTKLGLPIAHPDEVVVK